MTAHIAQTAIVEKSAQVNDRALVADRAIVEHDAVVQQDAEIAGDAIVSGQAIVEGSAQVYGEAMVEENAYVGLGALVGGTCRVTGQAHVLTGPFEKGVFMESPVQMVVGRFVAGVDADGEIVGVPGDDVLTRWEAFLLSAFRSMVETLGDAAVPPRLVAMTAPLAEDTEIDGLPVATTTAGRGR